MICFEQERVISCVERARVKAGEDMDLAIAQSF